MPKSERVVAVRPEHEQRLQDLRSAQTQLEAATLALAQVALRLGASKLRKPSAITCLETDSDVLRILALSSYERGKEFSLGLLAVQTAEVLVDVIDERRELEGGVISDD